MSVDPKYADLPWIAHGQPDVYEAGDLPESDQSSRNQGLTDEVVLPKEIERIKLCPEEAYKRFANSKLDASNVDFSDSIAGRGKVGYSLDMNEYDVLPTELRHQETLPQRLQRMQTEVSQLLQDVSSLTEETKTDKEPSVNASQLAQFAESLREQLTEVQANLQGDEVSSASQPSCNLLKQRVLDLIENFKPEKPTNQGENASLVYELYDRPDRTKEAVTERAADLDRRIQRLEALIGKPDPARLSALTADTAQHTLLEAASRLAARSALIQPGHLDVIETRLTGLQNRLQAITEKRESIADADTQNKVAALYELVNKWNDVADSLPMIVQRLTALKVPHEQATEFARTLEAIEGGQKSLEDELKNYKSLLEEVQTNFKSNMEIISGNVAAIEQRLSKPK